MFKTDVEGATKFYSSAMLSKIYHKNRSNFVKTPISNQGIDTIIYYMQNSPDNSYLVAYQLGGVTLKTQNDCSFPHKASLYWMQYTTSWFTNGKTNENIQWVDSFYDQMQLYLKPNNACYYNCPDSALQNPLVSYFENNVQQLINIKTKYNPHNILANFQSLPTKKKFF